MKELELMSDEEALLWYRQMRISKAMESFIKSDFYGDDFGLMCLRMREEIKALYEWIAEAKKKYPELPDVPDYEDDDEQVDRLYEKAVLWIFPSMRRFRECLMRRLCCGIDK